MLRRLAFDAATSFERFCIVLNDNTRIYPENIIELYSYVKDRIYLFIDNAANHEAELVYLLKKLRKENVPLSIILTERSNVWNTDCQDLSNYLSNSYHVGYLNNTEIRELLKLLERHNSLYSLKEKTEEERIKAFEERAGRELLVALYEATTSKTFEEIIFDEYKSIHDTKAQSLYLTISIFHTIGAEARAGFISRVHDISFHDFKERLFKPLEYIVFDKRDYSINDYVYLTRNRLIAEIVFERVLTLPQDRFDEYIRILNHLNIDYLSDNMAFMAIVNAKKLLNAFSDPQMIRKIYQVAEKISPNNPKLYQQQAIFEMKCSGGSLLHAENHIKKAKELQQFDPIILHTYSELLLEKAEKSKNEREFSHLINEVIEVCSKLTKKDTTYSHPYHTILKAHILKFKKTLNAEDTPSIERSLKDIEKVLATTKQYYPNDPFLLETESSFNELIDENSTAQSLLEKAFESNKSSPFIALRLSNFYEKSGTIEKAIQTIKEAVSLLPSDKDLNYNYALLLGKIHTPDFETIKYHLKRAFTSGDNRYQAQFWYARTLYLTNEIQEAKTYFKSLGTVNISPDVKYNPNGHITNNGKEVIFDGSILSVEVSFGFIKRDGVSDDIYFYRFHNEHIDWELLKRGVRVSFNVAFNYKGAVALNIQLK